MYELSDRAGGTTAGGYEERTASRSSDAFGRGLYELASGCPATTVLVVATCAVFAAMGFPLHGSDSQQLISWGADWGPLTLAHQWWRLFSTLFVHNGFTHIFPNLIALWIVGRVGERFFGTWHFLFLFFATGIGAELVGLMVTPEELAYGSSGAIFGVMGAIIAGKGRASRRRFEWVRSLGFWALLVFALFSLYAGIIDETANNVSHIAGLVLGLLLGLLLYQTAKSHDRVTWPIYLTTGLALLIMLLFVRWNRAYVVFIGRAVSALSSNDINEAQRDLNQVLSKHPNDVPANVLLGDICLRRDNYACAESSLKTALRVQPDNNSATLLLGQMYLRTGRINEALETSHKLIRRGAVGPEELGLFAAAMDAKGLYEEAGQYYLDLQRYEEAIAAFQKALQKDPNDKNAIRGLIRAYRAKGMNKEADALEGKSGHPQ